MKKRFVIVDTKTGRYFTTNAAMWTGDIERAMQGDPEKLNAEKYLEGLSSTPSPLEGHIVKIETIYIL